MEKGPVVFIFNAPLSSGCDYVTQTLRLISKRTPTYGVALGDVIGLRQLLFGKNVWIIKTIDGARVVRPVSLLPGLRLRVVRNISYGITCFILRLFLAVRYFGQKMTVWFFEPFHIAELLRIFTGYQSIYDCVDYYPGFSSYAKQAHETLLRKATYVFANSITLQNTLKETRPDTKLVPLGFARELFDSGKKKQPKNKMFTVGYVGSISARLDYHFLIDSVLLMPHVHFVFVGSFEKDVFGTGDTAWIDFTKLLSFPNVRWIEEVPKNKIPITIAGFDACMIPYDAMNEFNLYSFPMKTMEYLFMQKPTISTKIKEIAKLGVVKIVSSPEQFAQFVTDVEQGKWTNDDKQKARKITLQNTWEEKIKVIISTVFPQL